MVQALSRVAGARPRAIVDIGSNTVRLVIYGQPLRAPQVLHNEKVAARLGKGVAESGNLSPKAMALALASLARFRAILDLKGFRKSTWWQPPPAAMRAMARPF
jgi:exopolyphosphatase/guanosine-5'-triphosphate,3'-diphosphate pyrophosphatase